MQAPTPVAHCATPTSPLSDGLVRIWIAQRKLLRVMDEHRQADSLNADSFATEVVTDGYYLVRKNLSDLVALNQELPMNALNHESKLATAATTTVSVTTEPHSMLAHDLAALNALAADYSSLQAEAESAHSLNESTRSLNICAVVRQHSRQLKEFLTNLFPDSLPA